MYRLKRLPAVITLSAVSIHRDEESGSWCYDGSDGSDEIDPLYGFNNLLQLYEKADPSYKGSCSVPLLWDRKMETIVSNDSSDITRMLRSVFDVYLAPEFREVNKPGGGFLPGMLKMEIEELKSLIQDDVVWGTYKCGFAQTQQHYDDSMASLFERLDQLEERLSSRKYLLGDHITEADIWYGLFYCEVYLPCILTPRMTIAS